MGCSSFSTKLKQEFFSGWITFEASWLIVFLAIQIGIFIYQPDTWIATIAAITGILCVVFVGKGKISNYLFGLISVSLYAYISYTFQLYGEMMLNLLVYVPVQFIGFYFWRKNMTSENTVNNAGVEEVIAKALTAKQWVIVAITTIIGTFLYIELLKYLGSALAILDGATVVISIVAQILMVLRYREQWALWIIVNMMTIALWTAMYFQNGETSLPLLVMYVMYLCNSIYGYYNWIKLHRKHQQ
ncbi:nicotinamide riboside transporter PnuC [Mannheimia haemolytica]|uniref:nicotinamide riboside transporter PnuC n=1 Tax=Mannheimia haemolytica TaxID=75985 RepID=UPI0001BCF649|nr:nicotinamide riboside transporter PnuC [Mannheimia haemolytica]EEY11401.1 NR family nicotinamide ribonucleoside uptake permease [Mannheimia haemolytica serotype A2 str. BOVINE]MDW0722177.1 nicotinamide riboside transporter PnuC [Mannheimia haemolytica]MDW0735171.1 nicotinamide riboside transporter PnuC [Mannheimia haemolytica]TRC11564.1 nicotinamide riboside transporter PnuC [Mannheimia haemolytica]TRC56125.1 nicotinamide riboside transporter PnuC [Mannheimia haemolytica]